MSKTYKLTAKIDFEMVGNSKKECLANLTTLLDALVECHSDPSDNPDFFHEFTGTRPSIKSCSAKIIKGK